MTPIYRHISRYITQQILMNVHVIARCVTRKPRATTQLDLTSVHVTQATVEMVGQFALVSIKAI